MILVLDPALFLAQAPSGEMTETEERELSLVLDEIVRLCRERNPQIPDHEYYWRPLQQEIVAPRLKALRSPVASRIREAWTQIRHHARPLPFMLPPAPGRVRMWGVHSLYSWRFGPEWLARMSRLFVECVLAGGDTYLLVRLVEGRNQRSHEAEGCELIEKLRWRLRLNVPGHPPAVIPCIRSRRNLQVPWTTRLDDRLPAQVDGGACPFCPPGRWHLRDVEVFATRSSRPTWLDARGNAWARPRTGGGHHWDVYLNPQTAEEVGLAQINVAQFDPLRRDRGKVPGDVHHIPKDKGARLHREPGWKCE